jgi:two-component system sensor histidine kinase UhpB
MWISENTHVVYDKGGELLSYEGVVEDIKGKKLIKDELRISREQFRNLSVYLQSAIEQERTYIAREIHDELGQMLTALRMDLVWIKNKMPKNSTSLIEKAESMLQIVDTASNVVQKIATELRPKLLDDFGLTAAIEWQIGEFQNRTGIKCDLTFDPENILLGGGVSTAIYRILQETLTNIMRHSNATRVSVSLRELNDVVKLKVRDNGKGIKNEQISNDKSIGIIGIKERARLLDGEVDIIGIHGIGTTVTVRIPHEEETGIHDKNTHCR